MEPGMALALPHSVLEPTEDLSPNLVTQTQSQEKPVNDTVCSQAANIRNKLMFSIFFLLLYVK